MAPRDDSFAKTFAKTASRADAPIADTFGDTEIGPLTPIPALLRRFGADPPRVLRSVGIEPHVFENAENRLSLERLGRLLRACIDATGQPHFALLVGSEFKLPMLNLLGYLVRHQPTVRAALRTLVLQLHLQDRGAVAALDESGARYAQVSYAVCTPGVPETGLIHSTAIMVGFRLLKILCGSSWRPVEVRITAGNPADASVYREMFESKVRFEMPLSMVVFERHWLDARIAGADPDLLRVLNRMAAAVEGQVRMSLAHRVRRVLRSSVLAGTANSRRLSEIFSLSERGLRRHLAREGVALNDLIGEARQIVSEQLLEQTSLSLREIAGVLHYADPSVFSRAFRSWSGISPSEWRRAAVARTPSKSKQRRAA